VLYDADRIHEIASVDESELVTKQRELILNPFDPEVIAQAQRCGVHASVIEAAQKSPVYKFVKEWELALPLHPEFRTLPMLFYVPPLLPIAGKVDNGTYDINSEDFFSSLDRARIPIQYMAKLFSAGNEEIVKQSYRKLMAIRLYKRAEEMQQLGNPEVQAALKEAGVTPERCEAIYRLTSLPTMQDRFVIPPMHREYAIALMEDPAMHKGATGVGFHTNPERGL
jgi:nitrate reductase beta subunit